MNFKNIWNKLFPILSSILIGLTIGGIIGGSWLLFDNAMEVLFQIDRKLEIYHLQQQLQIREIMEFMKKGFDITIENDIKQLQLDKGLIILLDSMTYNIEALKEHSQRIERRLQATKMIDIKNAEQIKQANVLIGNTTQNIGGSGTHIRINEESYILTCAHLIVENEDTMIAILDNGDIHPLQLAKINKNTDLALFRIFGTEHLSYFEISDVEPKEGSEIIIIGNPDNMTDVITEGTIAKIHKDKYVFTNLMFYGNSGGAMLYKGKVVGIVNQLGVMFEIPVFVNYGYAIKLETIKDFLGDVK